MAKLVARLIDRSIDWLVDGRGREDSHLLQKIIYKGQVCRGVLAQITETKSTVKTIERGALVI